MKYHGKLFFTSQKLSLLLATAVLLAVASLLVFIKFSLIYWLIPAVILAVLLYVDLLHAERKSSAFILENEIIINLVLAFGLFVYVYRKRLSAEEVETIQHFLDLLEATNNPISHSAFQPLMSLFTHILFFIAVSLFFLEKCRFLFGNPILLREFNCIYRLFQSGEDDYH